MAHSTEYKVQAKLVIDLSLRISIIFDEFELLYTRKFGFGRPISYPSAVNSSVRTKDSGSYPCSNLPAVLPKRQMIDFYTAGIKWNIIIISMS